MSERKDVVRLEEQQDEVILNDPWRRPAGNCEWLNNLKPPDNLDELTRQVLDETKYERMKRLRPYETRVTLEDLTRVIGG